MDNFSVAMCVYEKDNQDFFRIAIESILNQTCQPEEVVLVVDGYVGNKLNEVITAFEKNPIFHIIRLKTNVGHGNARRIALENCTNELVALMDADDISVPDRFEKQLDAFSKKPEISIVGGNITEFIGNPQNIIGSRVVPKEDRDIKAYMKKRCPMNQVTVMFRQSDIAAVGGYVDWYCDEDYYLWIRLALRGYKFANIGETLVNVRVGDAMYARRGGVKYFLSEIKLQKFMLEKKMISLPRYLLNVSQRFILQIMMPNRLRSWFFENFAREKEKKNG